MRNPRTGRIEPNRSASEALRSPHIDRQEPGPGRNDDRLKLAVRTELRQDVLDVAAGGMQAYDQLVRDRPGVEPFPHQGEYFPLPGGEPGPVRLGPWPCSRRGALRLAAETFIDERPERGAVD